MPAENEQSNRQEVKTHPALDGHGFADLHQV